jgi:hypothetical protein
MGLRPTTRDRIWLKNDQGQSASTRAGSLRARDADAGLSATTAS